MGPANVYVVDGDPTLRRYLCEVLAREDQCVRGFAGPADFESTYTPQFPECLLLGLSFPGDDGLDLLRRLRIAGHGLPVLVLAGHGDVRQAVEAMKLGALDFLQEPFAGTLLLRAVEQALMHRRSPSEVERLRSRALLERITPRQHEVLELVASGLSSKEIAARLGLSKKTVDIHRGNLLRRLEARSLVDLIRIHALQ